MSWEIPFGYYPGPRPKSNRLIGTSLPGDDEGEYTAEYTHDEHGNMLTMPHLSDGIEWDFKDQMRHADKGGGGDVYFTYDASGQRVRKVWVHSGIVEERIYLGAFELYRRHETGLVRERETLHIMDDTRRIAMVETKTVDTAVVPLTVTSRIRYQLGNHLGSAMLELDHEGLVISYEEYHPYGTSAYRAVDDTIEVSARRYRYTGKERDEETGLYYHGARYYACWLGRWTSADPAGMVDGPNVFVYVRNRPTGLHDPSGTTNTPANDIDKQIAQMTDAQLHRFLEGKSSAQDQWDFAHAASGMFKERAAATLHNLGVEEPTLAPPPTPKEENPHPRSLDSFTGKDFLIWDPSKSLQQVPAVVDVARSPSASAPSQKKGTEVIFWDQTGTGQASFGHVSVVIDNISYSYGPPGAVVTLPRDEYMQLNLGDGGATGLELDLSEEQKAGLKESYELYRTQPYDALFCNCGDPAEDYLRNVYPLDARTATPEMLYQQLRPYATRENRYGMEPQPWYLAPWGTRLGQTLLDPPIMRTAPGLYLLSKLSGH